MTECERLLSYVMLDHARRLEKYCSDRECKNCVFWIDYCALHEAPSSANLDAVEQRLTEKGFGNDD